MKISDMIRQLTDAWKEHGDLEVACTYVDVPEYPAMVIDTSVAATKEDGNILIVEYDRECYELAGEPYSPDQDEEV